MPTEVFGPLADLRANDPPPSKRYCSYCGAEPGSPCTGNPEFGSTRLDYFHAARRNGRFAHAE